MYFQFCIQLQSYEKNFNLGSTSSIGKTLLGIIEKDKKNFKIELLTANTNYKDLIKQAKKFNVKNIIITDPQVSKKQNQ